MEVSFLTLTLALGIIMILGCFIPKKWLPKRMPHDGYLHILAFVALSAPLTFWGGELETVIGIAAILFVLGWLVEVLQTLTPDRNFGWDDLKYNAIGILVGSILGIFASRFF